MIGTIRNKYLRRIAIVCAVPFFMLAIFIVGAFAAVEEFVRDEVRRAW